MILNKWIKIKKLHRPKSDILHEKLFQQNNYIN